LGFDIEWSGKGIDEVGIDRNTGKIIVQINPNYYRPTEVETLIGDCTKVKIELGWEPEYTFEKLVKEMCESDLKLTMEKKNEFVY
jgi:GDPmannose 4,6-dehydratase